ncbi:halobacterial transducer protein 4 domain protein [Halorubrum sp. AJ67]|nr:halobacterial transducer protein 4 domain protein [Halorubrum sp. AJ67]
MSCRSKRGPKNISFRETDRLCSVTPVRSHKQPLRSPSKERTSEINDAAETDTDIREISDTTDDQAASIEEVVTMIEEVSDIGRKTANESDSASAAAQQQPASMSQVSDNVESLSGRAKQLRELLSTFDVSESALLNPQKAAG